MQWVWTSMWTCLFQKLQNINFLPWSNNSRRWKALKQKFQRFFYDKKFVIKFKPRNVYRSQGISTSPRFTDHEQYLLAVVTETIFFYTKIREFKSNRNLFFFAPHTANFGRKRFRLTDFFKCRYLLKIFISAGDYTVKFNERSNFKDESLFASSLTFSKAFAAKSRFKFLAKMFSHDVA